MSPDGPGIVAAVGKRLPRMLEDIGCLVRAESPSADLDAVARSADVVSDLGLRLLGTPPERITTDGRTHLRWQLGTGPHRVLVLGHHDTVWPVGSVRDRPFTVENGILRGPGCFDMKTGIVMALHALAELNQPAEPSGRDDGEPIAAGGLDGVTVLITGDEELGSPTSRDLIESTADGCAAVLVLEAAADGGDLKCERKGASQYEIHLRGRAAHAGLEPQNGINTTIELAHQILALAGMARPADGTSVTPTVAASGTTLNTVPARASLQVDCRMWTGAEQQRVDREIRARSAVDPGCRITVTGGPNRPPLEKQASRSLFDLATLIADRDGHGSLRAAAVGGASDGNFTAGMGIPTLDGLGAVGGGAHAVDEHVVVAMLAPRTALLAGLLAELTR